MTTALTANDGTGNDARIIDEFAEVVKALLGRLTPQSAQPAPTSQAFITLLLAAPGFRTELARALTEQPDMADEVTRAMIESPKFADTIAAALPPDVAREVVTQIIESHTDISAGLFQAFLDTSAFRDAVAAAVQAAPVAPHGHEVKTTKSRFSLSTFSRGWAFAGLAFGFVLGLLAVIFGYDYATAIVHGNAGATAETSVFWPKAVIVAAITLLIGSVFGFFGGTLNHHNYVEDVTLGETTTTNQVGDRA